MSSVNSKPDLYKWCDSLFLVGGGVGLLWD